MKTYVTFGTSHVHRINGKVFDAYCVAVVDGDRDEVFKIFGTKFCFEYSERTWDERKMKYFPRGYVYVETEWIVDPDPESLRIGCEVNVHFPNEGWVGVIFRGHSGEAENLTPWLVLKSNCCFWAPHIRVKKPMETCDADIYGDEYSTDLDHLWNADPNHALVPMAQEDANKLRILAEWFDAQEITGRWGKSKDDEVQRDLRSLADRIEAHLAKRPHIEPGETVWVRLFGGPWHRGKFAGWGPEPTILVNGVALSYAQVMTQSGQIWPPE